MKKHLLGVALMSCLLMMGGVAYAQSINDIQVYTALGVPASPYAGQTVTVEGVIIENLHYSSGSHYIIGVGGHGISMYGNGGAVPAMGDLVSVTGVVGAFSGEIQLGAPISFAILSSGNTVTPEIMTIPQVLSTYENVGHYGRVTGTVARKSISGTPPLVTANIWIKSSPVDSMLIYIDKDTRIDVGDVNVGDLYQFTGPIVNFSGLIELKPVLQTDLVKNPGGDTLPVITNVNCANWVGSTAAPINVSATITDNIGITSAFLYYRDSDGVTPGGWTSVAMTMGAGNVWSASKPAGHTGSQVDFYIQATDTGAQTVKNPGNAPTGFFSVAIGMTSIYAMQTVHPDSTSQSNKFLGKFLNVKGVVTAAGVAQTGAASKFVLQELAKNPATNSYAFGGVLVYEGSGKYPYYQGDVVEVGGRGDEYFGLTEMLPHNAEAVNFISFGHVLPAPAKVHTRVLADDNPIATDGDGALGEAWESVWVTTWNAAVKDTVGLAQYKEWLISDTGVRADSLRVDTYSVLAYTPTIGDVVTVTGFMDYEFGTFKIRPLDDSYVTLTGLSAVDNNVPTIEKAGGFRSIHPNPFNPTTNIKFVVNRDNMVQINVYNIRGEKVRTLIQDRLPANEYNVTWDGTDDSGKTVASGSYFARLRIAQEVMQVRQMQLVK